MNNFVKLSTEEIGDIKKGVMYIAALREELLVVSNKILGILQKAGAPTLMDDEDYSPSKDIGEFRKNNVTPVDAALTLNDEDFDKVPNVKIAKVTEARKITDQFVDKTTETVVPASDIDASVHAEIPDDAAEKLQGRLG